MLGSISNTSLFVNASMASNLTSPGISIQYVSNVAISLIFTGTPVGVFSVLNSLDNSNWVALPIANGTVLPFAAGSADDILIDLNQLAAGWIQVVFTRVSGTGTLNGILSAKQI